MSACHTNNMLLTTDQKPQFQPHNFAMLFTNVFGTMVSGKIESLNCVGNDKTYNHSLLNVSGNAP